MNIRLIRGMRTWRACIRSHDARARSYMHAQHAGSRSARVRARRSAAGSSRQAHREAVRQQRCGSNVMRVDVGLHAVMLVLRAVKERGT